MAQQTINVGTAPNDGTGTPLRTAFQYTNSNFSELYTAVGPSGNNIVVPGTATITGDLTVDTSTLKVDSANNRVGIGTASPAYLLDIADASFATRFVATNTNNSAYGAGVYLKTLNGASMVSNATLATSNDGTFSLLTGTSSDSTKLSIGPTGIFTFQNVGGVAGTAMTLNSTGLGIGGSPSNKLSVFAGADGDVGFFRGGSTRQVQIGTSATAGYLNTDNGSAGLEIRTQGTARAYFDNSGNVGVGVTPSAWGSNKAIEGGVSGGKTGALMFGSDGSNWLINNAIVAASTTYKATAAASYYYQNNGLHIWSNAPSGTAGNAITWTQAMTLDASGNLLVGKTATGVGTVGNEIKAVGEFYSTQSASTNANFTYHVYSTGAAAYRFYVGLGGTVYATNTTISAISDARLKENVQDIDVGLDAILALKPRKFDWKNGKGKNIKGDRGFIAQEFETVFPNLVDEWKDPAPEGEAPYKSVRQDLIPVLVKAIQQLTDRVITLENK